MPSEKDRINEKGISIADGIPKFAPHTEVIFQAEDQIDWNAAIRTYATFRTLMREGEAADTTLQIDEGPKRKRKRAASDEQAEQAAESSPMPPAAAGDQEMTKVSPE